MLTSISPIDGRYYAKVKNLSAYFSEYAIFKYRVWIEIEYFIALCELPLVPLKQFNKSLYPQLRKLYKEFSIEDALHIKEIEKKINHDVKAVEYFIKEKFEELDISVFKEFIHFGLTSQDINNTAFPLSIKHVLYKEYLPTVERLLSTLRELSTQWKKIPMLAFTHGQPASPTRMGKEINVFIYRVEQQKKVLLSVPHAAKFGGAVGNFNAHHVAFPNIDWDTFADSFLENILQLKRERLTTQISNYDHFGSLCDTLKRINTIFIDCNRDIWTYIAKGYFNQKIKKGEIGSSAMPHKINPIDFENAEGNLGIANALYNHLSEKLPISRLQRDLTDSTVLRNIGVPFAHTLIALQSMLTGFNKLQVNKKTITTDLENSWTVVAEAIQTILRRENYPQPYEALKALTRTNEKITKQTIHQFIDQLEISETVKMALRKITPFNYTGI